ncbi:hypothetical protein [Kitasatospora sp. MAP5-34]|nr:hypothetical protein [Kitasatospora sp. MAP5-34]MDH6578547.1 hypothetical protein [Kitasatospora sp. MAP5-34]
MIRSVVAVATGLIVGAGLLFVAVPSSAAPAPAPVVHQDGGSGGSCC